MKVVASYEYIHYIVIEVVKVTENKYGLVNRVRISNAIDKELYEKLQEISKETMIPVSKLLDKAISLLVKEYE